MSDPPDRHRADCKQRNKHLGSERLRDIKESQQQKNH